MEQSGSKHRLKHEKFVASFIFYLDYDSYKIWYIS